MILTSTKSNYRYYSDQQIVTLLIIKKLRMLGFGIKKIKDVLGENKIQTLEKGIEEQLNQRYKEIADLECKAAIGEDLLHRLKTGSYFFSQYSGEVRPENQARPWDVQLERVVEETILFERELMPAYKNAEVSLPRWANIMGRLEKLGLQQVGPYTVTYRTHLLGQFLMQDCDVEFAIPIKVPFEEERPYLRKFGGFLAATAVHMGDYSKIMDTHVRILQWINQNQYEVAGDVSEEFIISPIEINNKHENVTKVIIPVRKAQ